MKGGTAANPPSQNARQQWAVALFVTGFCLIVAWQMVDLGESFALLSHHGPQAWAGGIGLCLSMGVLRAIRLVVVIRDAPLAQVVRASFLHGAANAVLPAKLGEAILPVGLAHYAGLDFVRAVGVLFLLRLGDLFALLGAGLLLVAVADFWTLTTAMRVTVGIGGTALLAGILFLPWLIRLSDRRRPEGVAGLTGRFAAAADPISTATALMSAGLTAAIWVALGLAAELSLASAGLSVGMATAWLASIAASLAFALPTNGLASFGPFEAAFVAVIVTAGAPAEAALAAAIHLHLCALAAAAITGVAASVFPQGSVRGSLYK